MRLLWVIDSLTLGGAERLAVTFARALGGRAALTVCALKTIGGNPVEAPLRALGVDVVNLEARNLRDRAALRRLTALVTERGIDVIHAHLTYASIWAALAARRTGVPLVATLHTLPAHGHPWSRDRIRQRIMALLLARRAFRVIAVSRAQAEAWVAAGLISPAKIAVVPNGVELPALDAAETRHSFLPGSPQIGTAAVLREGKGIDVLLRAFGPIVEAIPAAILTIAGDGPLRRELEALGDSLGLAGSVRWLGYRDDVPALLQSFDVVVHPSLVDALPTSVLEAMAAGIPVVASATGGIPEIITDGRDGLLVPPGDEAALTRAINRLLRHRTLLREMGSEARRKIEGEFSAARWVERLEAIYEEARGERAR